MTPVYEVFSLSPINQSFPPHFTDVYDLNLAKHGNPNSRTGKIGLQFGLALNQEEGLG